VFHHDVDGNGNPEYTFFALPGTLDTDAAWRGFKYLWSGTTLQAVLWADGNSNLDNVYASRASLTYTANAALSWLTANVAEYVPSGARPGTSFAAGFTLALAPWELLLNTTPMVPIGSGSPVGNQVLASGTTLQTGVSVAADEPLILRVWMA
jgi:hypothetical protein